MQVLTAVSNPHLTKLDGTQINHITDIIKKNDGKIQDIDALKQLEAFEISFSTLHPASVDKIFAEMERFKQLNLIDFAIQEKTDDRKKKLLLADMDSTIIEQECLDDMALLAGIKDKIQLITEKAMRGELNFENALIERINYLTDVPVKIMEQVYEKIKIRAGAKSLVNTMKVNGARTILISGGFTFFTEKIANAVGFDIQKANVLEASNGLFTGKVRMPILGPNAKLECLKTNAKELGISIKQAIAVGDGANDLGMIQNAGIGVAFKAKPIIRNATQFRIDYCDLTALLYFQGYNSYEIHYIN